MIDLQSDDESSPILCIMSLGAAQMSERVDTAHIQIVADIVSAYVSNNSVRPTDLPALIESVHDAISLINNPTPVEAEPSQKATSSEVRKSVHQDYLISFLDGKRYKSLRRHLSTRGYTPESYRETFGLPKDYSLVSKGYSAQRSALAKEIGLGALRSSPSADKPANTDKVPGKRGRPRKEVAAEIERKVTPYAKAEQTRKSNKSNEVDAEAA